MVIGYLRAVDFENGLQIKNYQSFYTNDLIDSVRLPFEQR